LSRVLSTLTLGFLLGVRHATDADHVLALGTIVARDPKLGRALGTGAYWGLGHSATVLAVGALVLIGGVRMPDGAAAGVDLAVASMLVVLGVLALRPSAHAHGPASPEKPGIGDRVLLSRLRPFAVGVVHGLAGSAALTLVAATTLRDTRAALAYLGVFGVGTIAGMLAITLLLASSLRWATARHARASRLIARLAAFASLGAGLLLASRALASQ